ncbi:MAG: energy transducer TonB [Spirochaetes bacterium]|nr:energy transducer TonB [Spirochaetota bacterium]
MNTVQMNATMTYPRVINFFRLRPELTLFFVSFTLLYLLIQFLRWEIVIRADDFADLSSFEMVELSIPVSPAVEQEIVTQDEYVEDTTEKEEQLKFGDDRGHYNLAGLSAVAPQAKISSLPTYPDSVRKLGIEGVVITEVGIDERGSVVYAKIVKKLHPVLDRIVLDWFRTISFYPAMDASGNAFKCKIYYPIRFKLTE